MRLPGQSDKPVIPVCLMLHKFKTFTQRKKSPTEVGLCLGSSHLKKGEWKIKHLVIQTFLVDPTTQRNNARELCNVRYQYRSHHP